MPTKKSVVLHSGGMDSSICLALAIQEFGKENVLSLNISYGQRHSNELQAAREIAEQWGVDRFQIEIPFMKEITNDALLNHSMPIEHPLDAPPNTLVLGRNGLMAHIAGIHAGSLGASHLFMGVMEIESENSGYRDCSRSYMDLKEAALRIDLDNPSFKIRTPLISMTKLETLQLADELGVLPFLLEKSITCYNSQPYWGCQTCPSCLLRNQAIRDFQSKSSTFELRESYRL